ncbi:MAG: ROK family protein [Candidatus Pseudobacter hemicellulosilyticus]|uniref:ROK family protein n=1 Tax=Candidatus Pseudobacter hemicellulosilyticus TaxID=3121375 RepID=A0AAJ5WPK8_9BACT|nr:MAG: ROK family protein [Pseudobacter sp.]
MFLGIDIGGTKCALVIGKPDDEGMMQVLDKISTPTDKPVYEMITKLFSLAEQLLQQNNLDKKELQGIGISCGGPLNSKRGRILSPPNLPGWDDIPIVDMAEHFFQQKVLLQNDANACAVAEWKYGAGKGADNIIFLTFGTGMGAGLILNGRLYAGATDLAGEVGHIRLADAGPVGFGKSGSFEGYCSGGGIAQLGQMKARERIQMGQSTAYCKSLDELPYVTAKTVAEAAMKGDATAIAVYTISAEYLGRALAILIDALNPELIILGSIFGRAKTLIEKKMWSAIHREAFKDSVEACRIVAAGLGENIGDVAALSLAAMAADEKEAANNNVPG